MRAVVLAVLLAIAVLATGTELICGLDEQAVIQRLNLDVAGRRRPYPVVDQFKSAYQQAVKLRTWLHYIVETVHHKDIGLELMFAFYTDHSDSYADCMEAKSGPFVDGGGTELCNLLHAEAGVGGSSQYFKDMLTITNVDQWANISQGAKRLGYDAYSRFNEDDAFVYIPPNVEGVVNTTRWPPSLLHIENSEHGLPYYGLSGGGGSGMGWQLTCAANDGEDPSIGYTLVTGGGGGGGGMASPEHGYGIRSGGGGGGGAQFPAHGQDDDIMVGAGVGSDGLVLTNPDSDPGRFIERLAWLNNSVVACGIDRHLEIRGGGGGGGGFEVYDAWNVEDPSATPPERVPHAVSFGWGFQFSIRQNTTTGSLLYSSPSDKGTTYVVCPSASSPFSCSTECFSEASQQPTGAELVSSAFSCGPAIAAGICGLAHTNQSPPQNYGTYGSSQSCNSPILSDYLTRVLPDEIAYKPYPGHTAPGTNPLPTITPDWIAAHKSEFCPPTPAGCPPYPPCA